MTAQNHFNPRSPCGERPTARWRPRTWRDFNPRSPCGERPLRGPTPCSCGRFQSTLSLRRATWPVSRLACSPENFNPRSPCGERPQSRPPGDHSGYFNPRSPCGERRFSIAMYSQDPYFNPRSPCGERPQTGRAGWPGYYFNPRSPCGERRRNGVSNYSKDKFQSTLSLRRATRTGRQLRRHLRISIHALLAESDSPDELRAFVTKISIHALLAESDTQAMSLRQMEQQFQSTLSLRRATGGLQAITSGFLLISIHALLAESDCRSLRYI